MPLSVEPAYSSAKKDLYSPRNYDTIAQPAPATPQRQFGGHREGSQRLRGIRVHINNPAPVGFGSNVPSAGRMSSGSVPSTPPTPLMMGVEAKAFAPVKRATRESALSTRESAAPHKPNEVMVSKLTPEHSGNFLDPEVHKGTYLLDPEYTTKALVAQKSVKKMDEEEMKKWGLDRSPSRGRQAHLMPPAAPSPTIGQQRRALAEGDDAQKRPLSRDLLSGRPRSRGEEFATLGMAQMGAVKPPFRPLGAKQSSALLDGFMMLKACSAELPEEVEVIDLSSRSIDRVEEADLVHFSQARKVNVSDNHLEDLKPLASLPSLQILNAAANCMMSITVPLDSFGALQELDLSFNQLQASAPFEQLSSLPSLRKLDLTGNAMPSIPETIRGFAVLEELSLACNGLSGNAMLALQLLPSLKRLFMQDNVVSTIPDWTEEEPFQCLEELDLTNNHINAAGAMLPLEELPSLRRVALAGNPLSARANLAAKRAAMAKDAEYRAAGIPELKADVEQILQSAVAPPQPAPLALPAPGAADEDEDVAANKLEDEAPQLSRIKVELKAPILKPPSLSKLYGHGQLPVVIDDLAKALPDPDNPLAGMTGMLKEKDVNHDAVMAAFGRLETEIKGWEAYAEEVGYGLEPVDEGEEEDLEDYTDNTFLTGIGMPVEGLPDQDAENSKEEFDGDGGGQAQAPEEEVPEELQDPTVQLAIGLGLDPIHLSIFSGHLGGDCASAVKALRFALTHPLVGENEGLRPKPNHYRTTTSTKAKQRERYLKPMEDQPRRMPSLDVKIDKIQSIEEILSGMKDRLQTMETKLINEIGPESAEAALSIVSSVQQRGGSATATTLSMNGTPPMASASGRLTAETPERGSGPLSGGMQPASRGDTPQQTAEKRTQKPAVDVPPIPLKPAKASSALGYT